MRKKTMNSELKQINKASLVKRIFALVMDAAVAGFVMFGLVALVTIPIANKAWNYEEKIHEVDEAKVYSKLYVLEARTKDTEDVKIINNSDELEALGEDEQTRYYPLRESDLDINSIKDRLHYYYCVYRANDTANLVFEKGIYEAKTTVNYNDHEYSNEDFYNLVIAPVDDVEKLKNEFVYNAEYELSTTDRIVYLLETVEKIKTFNYGVPYVVSFGIFFVMIPLLFSNGETLGQKVLHIGYVNSDGYTIKKRQIVFKQLLLLVYVSIPLLIGGNIITKLAFLGLFLLAHFVTSFIDKKGRSPVDFAAFTMSVDTITSVWFESEDDILQFKCIHAKCYCERREDNKLHMTISGINKSAVELLNDDINNFECGFSFNPDASCVHKLLTTYCNNQPVVTYPDGYKSTYQYGKNMRRTGYVIDNTDEYKELLDFMQLNFDELQQWSYVKMKGTI